MKPLARKHTFSQTLLGAPSATRILFYHLATQSSHGGLGPPSSIPQKPGPLLPAFTHPSPNTGWKGDSQQAPKQRGPGEVKESQTSSPT